MLVYVPGAEVICVFNFDNYQIEYIYLPGLLRYCITGNW